VPASARLPAGHGGPGSNGLSGGNNHRRRTGEPVPMSAPTPEPPRSVIGYVPPAVDEDRPPPASERPDDPPPASPPRPAPPTSSPRSGAHRRPGS
ncbi:MAG: hypothetical protein ACRDRJ_48220, partial [Streptosporangiaceae bacterium]